MHKLKFLIIFTLMSFQISAKELIIRPKAYLDIDTGKMIFKKLLVIEDQKIKAIVEDNGRKDVLNLNNYLIPGMIDCHAHLLFTQTIEDNGFESALLRESRLGSEFRIMRAKKFMKQYLLAGFTGICDLGNSGRFLDARLKKETSDKSEYPRLFISGPGIAVHKGQFRNIDSINDAKNEYTIIDLNSDIDAVLKGYVDNDVDILKLYLDNSPGEGGLEEQNLKKILNSSSIKKFKKVTAHAILQSSFDKAIKLKISNLEHVNEMTLNGNHKDILKFVTATNQDIDTLKEFNYYNKVFFKHEEQKLRFLGASKIKLVFGPDFYFHKNSPDFNRADYVKRTINTYVDSGISNLDIIRALTLNPADSLGLKNVSGKIAVGYTADIIGFKKDPLQDIKVLQEKPVVFNRGLLVK